MDKKKMHEIVIFNEKSENKRKGQKKKEIKKRRQMEPAIWTVDVVMKTLKK